MPVQVKGCRVACLQGRGASWRSAELLGLVDSSGYNERGLWGRAIAEWGDSYGLHTQRRPPAETAESARLQVVTRSVGQSSCAWRARRLSRLSRVMRREMMASQ